MNFRFLPSGREHSPEKVAYIKSTARYKAGCLVRARQLLSNGYSNTKHYPFVEKSAVIEITAVEVIPLVVHELVNNAPLYTYKAKFPSSNNVINGTDGRPWGFEDWQLEKLDPLEAVVFVIDDD